MCGDWVTAIVSEGFDHVPAGRPEDGTEALFECMHGPKVEADCYSAVCPCKVDKITSANIDFSDSVEASRDGALAADGKACVKDGDTSMPMTWFKACFDNLERMHWPAERCEIDV